MVNKAIEILLVEDDPGDIDLMQEVLDEAKVMLNLSVVDDGAKAMEYLRREGQYTGVPRPDIVLLDLNLPRKNGREVLSEIKSDEGLKRIPVVILTTSDSEKDILETYGLGANCYVTKPLGLDQFAKIVKYIEDFWLTVVKLPRK